MAHWKHHKVWCKEAGNSSDLSRADFIKIVNIGKRGRVGLQNLGNSCYLNSILQCMSHVQPLTQFFLSNAWIEEVNEESMFGTNGRLVKEYASLLQDLWFDYKKVIYPKSFKALLGRLNEDWAGSAQHDTEEVMVWILDKLHEDLSRVKKKPYVEKGEGNGTNCVELAAKEWCKGKLREDSMVKDIVGGQIRSRLLCPDCDKVGVSFDPYYSINVEIKRPVAIQKSSITVKCMFVPGVRKGCFTQSDISSQNTKDRPVLFSVEIERGKPVSFLKQRVAEFLKNEELVVTTTVVEMFRMNEESTSLTESLVDVSSNGTVVNKVLEEKFATTDTFAVFTRDSVEEPVDESGKSVSVFLLHRRFLLRKNNTAFGPVLHGGYPSLAAHIFPTSTTCLQLRLHCWKLLYKYFAQDSFVRKHVAELKAQKDVSQEVEFHRRMAANLPLRLVTHKGKGRIPVDGENVFLQWQLGGAADPNSAEALYASLPGKETGSLLPADKEKTVASFLGGKTPTFLFLGMDWCDNGLYSEMLFENALSALTVHKSSLPQKRSESGLRDLTLQECLQEYTKDEMQVEGNTWYCNKCKKQQIARKKIDFLANYLPKVLIITLKRFEHRSMSTRYGSMLGHSQKIDTFVDFPLEGLDMAGFCTKESVEAMDKNAEPPLYDLFAVCNHYGRIGFGHYSAYARDWLPENDLSEQWISYDDDLVVPAVPQEVKTNAAYVLFYRRRPVK